MVDRPDPTCLPLELEMIPLHRGAGRPRPPRGSRPATPSGAGLRVRLATMLASGVAAGLASGLSGRRAS